MKRILLVTLMLLASLTAFSQTIPRYKGYVNDFANILSPQTETVLTNKISAYEKQSSIEIAIVTVSDLQGSYIEEYSMKLATEWGVGKKNQNNGLVMFVSTDKTHRGFRIEVGYGLEGRMTDAQSRNITRPTVQNYFKQSKFDEGMAFALDRVLEVVGPETQEQYAAHRAQQEKEVKESMNSFFTTLGYVVMCLVFTVIVLFALRLAYNKAGERRTRENERRGVQNRVNDLRRNVKANIESQIGSLTALEKQNFYGAKNTIAKLVVMKAGIGFAGADGKTKDFYEREISALEKVSKDCRELVDKVMFNSKLAREIGADMKKFKSVKPEIEKVIEKNQKVAAEIDKNNPRSVWTQTEPKVFPNVAFRSAIEYALKAEKLYVTAIACIAENAFGDADKAHRGAHVYLERAIKAATYPTSLKKEIAYHKKEAESKFKQLDSLKSKALKSVEREHVHSTTKEMVKGIAKLEKDVAKAFSVDKDTLDWFFVLVVVMALYNYLQRIVDLADGNIQSYHDAVRRKEEELQEEERRRRRRREEDEERRSSSYSSSYSSSSHRDSGGSSFGGFGGGSFGGGGSTSSW